MASLFECSKVQERIDFLTSTLNELLEQVAREKSLNGLRMILERVYEEEGSIKDLVDTIEALDTDVGSYFDQALLRISWCHCVAKFRPESTPSR